MWKRVREIIKKEFIQAFRQPRMRLLLFVPPLLQLVIFGYAVNLDVENGRIAWLDQDHTPESRELLAAIQGSRYLKVAQVLETREQVQLVLDHDSVQAVVTVLPGFARDIARGETAAVQILVDGTNSNTASILGGYVSQVVAGYSARVFRERQREQLVGRTMVLQGPVSLSLPDITSQTRVWFNPDLRSRNYFVPGVVVNIITMITLMLTAMAIVREKEIGTMEQLLVTPIQPIELILGKTLPFALVGLLDVSLMTGLALLVFHVPFQGNFLLLLFCSVLLLLSSLGIGLFISTISHTQQQAMMGSFFFFTPAFMLSGFAFPIRNMPAVVQFVTYLNPVRYFMEIVRGIFLKGAGVAILWPQMLSLFVYGIVILWLSALRFHKRLD